MQKRWIQYLKFKCQVAHEHIQMYCLVQYFIHIDVLHNYHSDTRVKNCMILTKYVFTHSSQDEALTTSNNFFAFGHFSYCIMHNLFVSIFHKSTSKGTFSYDIYTRTTNGQLYIWVWMYFSKIYWHWWKALYIYADANASSAPGIILYI